MKELKHPESTSIHFDDDDIKAARELWTPEAFQKATPLKMPEISNEYRESIFRQDLEKGIIQSVPGFDPGMHKLKGTPTEADVTKRPFWNCGGLTFLDSDGMLTRGSAQFCGDPRILLTAAHCVRSNKNGKYHTAFVFWQGYKNGITHNIYIKTAITLDAWVNGQDQIDVCNDYAFLITEGSSNAGWLGWATGINYNSWISVGYPGNYGGGSVLQRVDGTKGTVGSDVQMLGNPMREGCSGGAWIGSLSETETGNTNFAIGLNSAYRKGDTQNELGPYFGSDFVALYNRAVSLL